ncbi:chloride channel protein [Lactococcus insecticola]|uniref:Voltage-gated chloride channel protein n=1 Tax=Pseudolactococcus insecticola TaxID=2709158 RepID=A0A6A0B6T1_9LACT|nr:chloride channel protein [Lactococcus insecticola]GFH40646.1 voltage-gated chloride channel protein [Lactococcus insecticola]
MTKSQKKSPFFYQELLIYCLLAVIIGPVVGGLDAIFGRVLIFFSDFRTAHFDYLIPFLALAGLLIVFLYDRFGKIASRGMGLVFSVGHESDEVIPKRLIPLSVLTTWLTHLFGGSAGREGVAVQIGATFANFLGDRVEVKNRHILIMIGMSAGFGGLFQTPFAAALFAVEALVAGRIYYRALLPALIASSIAAFSAQHLGLEKFSFSLANHGVKLPDFDTRLTIKLLVLGVAFGLCGFTFSWLLKYSKAQLASLLPNPYVRIAAGGAVLSILMTCFGNGRYSGLGTNLIAFALGNGGQIFAWDFLLKLLLTVLTLSLGFQGGEVTPLFAIGASLGAAGAILLGLPPEFAAALGYAAVFASATNTFFAPIMIGCEIFGYNLMPYLLIVVLASYTLNFNQSIYGGQKTL